MKLGVNKKNLYNKMVGKINTFVISVIQLRATKKPIVYTNMGIIYRLLIKFKRLMFFLVSFKVVNF